MVTILTAILNIKKKFQQHLCLFSIRIAHYHSRHSTKHVGMEYTKTLCGW